MKKKITLTQYTRAMDRITKKDGSFEDILTKMLNYANQVEVVNAPKQFRKK